MSWIKYQINFFYKDVSYDKLSTQDLYQLYKLYNQFDPLQKSFWRFCEFKTFLFKYKYKPKNHLLFLGFIYFFKTLPLVKVIKFYGKYQLENNKSKFITMVSDPKWEIDKWVFFWSKWSKLRRPKLSEEEEKNREGFFEVYLNMWRKKVTKYINLKFFTSGENYVLHLWKLNHKLFKNKIVTIKDSKKRLNIQSPKLSSSSIVKLLKIENVNLFEFQFLRKNKVYNKGRYSRCRQNYRTGVYMCMYLSVVSIFGLYYWFFKFSFNFTYLWWLFIAFIGSFFVPKIIKYRLYEPTTILTKCFDFCKWSFLALKSIFY